MIKAGGLTRAAPFLWGVSLSGAQRLRMAVVAQARATVAFDRRKTVLLEMGLITADRHLSDAV
jgi:hypothetical protein